MADEAEKETAMPKRKDVAAPAIEPPKPTGPDVAAQANAAVKATEMAIDQIDSLLATVESEAEANRAYWARAKTTLRENIAEFANEVQRRASRANDITLGIRTLLEAPLPMEVKPAAPAPKRKGTEGAPRAAAADPPQAAPEGAEAPATEPARAETG